MLEKSRFTPCSNQGFTLSSVKKEVGGRVGRFTQPVDTWLRASVARMERSAIRDGRSARAGGEFSVLAAHMWPVRPLIARLQEQALHPGYGTASSPLPQRPP